MVIIWKDIVICQEEGERHKWEDDWILWVYSV